MSRAGIEDLSRLRYELERFLLGGAFELREDHKLIASVEAQSAAAEISYGKLILSCWGDGWSRSWRVLRGEAGEQTLQLECAKQMGRLTCALELRRGDVKGHTAASRREFTGKLAAMIEANFAALRVERAVMRRDDRRNFTGLHARLLLKEHGRLVAAAGVSPSESQHDIDATLGAGLIWFDWLRRRNAEINRLMLFVPRGRSDTIAARLTSISVKGATVSLCEVDEKSSLIQTVAPFDQGDLGDRLRRAALRARWPHERRAGSAAHTPSFREQSERWLESILQRNVAAIDASLDARYAYSQVPAYRGEQRSFIDLLTATRDGRLVVIELKISEDAEFPFQGLDYWLRVEWHRQRGDFTRRGYFKRLELADRPPLLYLVAPVFRFHATTKLLAACISRRVPVTRIGINEDWPNGVRVLLAEPLNSGE